MDGLIRPMMRASGHWGEAGRLMTGTLWDRATCNDAFGTVAFAI